MDSEAMLELAKKALEDIKARDVVVLDVRKLTSVTDYLLVASGTSDRHARSIADNLIEEAKSAGVKPLGVEGQDGGEWILVDLQDVVVHVMQAATRDFYKLEDLWRVDGSKLAEGATSDI
ncbi:MAG: ribosome silencing factor [Gammaproteobacteria bacterium]